MEMMVSESSETRGIWKMFSRRSMAAEEQGRFGNYSTSKCRAVVDTGDSYLNGAVVLSSCRLLVVVFLFEQ